MRKRFLRQFLAIAAFVFLVGIPVVFADVGQNPITLTNPLDPNGTGNCTDLYCPIKRVTDFLFTISIPIVGLFVLVGGFQMMTAAGNPEKFSAGKKTILYAVIGFGVVLIAGSVASLIQSILGGS